MSIIFKVDTLQCKAIKSTHRSLTIPVTDLNQALVDIRDIRRHLAQTTQFRGYGPLTLSATAALALLTGILQARWLPQPAVHPAQYVALWLTTGVVSAALIATQMLTRASRLHSGMADEMIRLALAQFLPAAITGLLLPFVLLHVSRRAIWMLPGLWQIVFGLGVFASCRCLPRALLLSAAWFLLTGFTCLLLGEARALAPASMAAAYAVGMTLVAAIHHLATEKVAPGEEPYAEEDL